MKPIKSIYLLFFVILAYNLSAQLDITDATTAPFTPENLVSNIFLGSGVEVTNIQYEGDGRAVGFFSGGNSSIGLNRGVVLSTGLVTSIGKPNVITNENGFSFPGASVQDEDLQQIADDNIDDIAMYTISFIPASDTLRFRYTFASEEYPEFICNINDVFGFFISGPNPDGGFYDSKNIALIPEISDPSGLTFTNIPVSINTVHGDGGSACPAQFPEYYNEVPLGTQNFQLNAFLDVFISEVVVIPCQVYTIKLGVADAIDEILDSAVFLEAKSFGTGTLAVSLNSLSVDGSLAEGCGTGALEFSLPEIVDEDYIIDIEFLNLSNSATPGLDYPTIPDQLIIPAGSNSVSVPLWAILDNISEMDEIISFQIQVDQCNLENFEIIIRDDNLFEPILPDDVTICDSENYLIDSELDPAFNLPPDPYFENLDPVTISPEMEPIYSDILVAGVIPTIMTPNIIESVCIIGLEHRDLTDFDIFLIAPGGQFLELTTDNGFKPNNFEDVDRYDNTCFTPFATDNINNGENLSGPIFDTNETYTGDFLPEGVWSDLWDGQHPTNGTWRLLVIDDMTGEEGILEGWSITFRSFYNLTYEWSSDPLSTLCENCEDIEVSPDEDTEYTLKIIDSYGCERSESINISVNPSITEPLATCGQITQNSIEITWVEVVGNIGYEVRINEGPWMPVSSTSFDFMSLSSSADYELEVRALGPTCNSEIVLLECRTNDCAQPAISFNIDNETSCPDSQDGEVTLTAIGLSPFTFELNGFTNSTGVFMNVPIGLNTFQVTDATGCAATLEVEMTGPDDFALNPGYRLSDPCNVISDITGSFNITGGSPPYTYNWSNLTTLEEAINLSPGTYFLTITDDNNCTASASLEIPVLEQFVYEVITTAPSCLDGMDGTATVNVITGNGPFTFEWDDGSMDEMNSNLEAGFYVVTATDVLGCSYPETFTIDDGAEVLIDVTPVDVSCLGQEDGLASVIVTGGVEPYSYFWNGGSSDADTTKGLAPGEFTLFVSDANNCMVSESFFINEPDGMSFAFDKTDNVCFAGSKGEITVFDVLSPNGDVDISWDDGGIGLERSGLINGKYCFTLNDGTICDLQECITISSPEEININEEIAGPNCENSEDGSISLTIGGGSAPFAYTWEGPIIDLPETDNIAGLAAGTYAVTVVDANSCQSVKTFDVAPSTPITIDQTVFPITCYGESSGQILFFASGGLPPFNYSWVGPEGFTATTNNIMGVSAGAYEVSYEDAAGCSGSQEFFIQEPSLPLSVNISQPDTICFGDANGQLTVSPAGGTLPYDIRWSNDVDGEENFGLASGAYQVTIIDSRGCESIGSSTIVQNQEIAIQISQTPSSCFQTNDGSAEITNITYGGNSASISDFDIKWNTSTIQNAPLVNNLIGGQSYTVVVRDKFGCVAQQTVEVQSPDEVGAEITTFSNVSCFNGGDGDLQINGTGGTGNYSYQWDFNAGSSTSNSIENLRKGNYAVTISDENGCIGLNRFAIEEPRPLRMDFRVIDVNCFEGNDGRAEAVVQGGVGPYSYLWTNDATGKAIEDVVSQQYNITVTDVNGCELTDSTKIEEPEEGIMVSVDIDDVSCNGGRNGKISVDASGGSGFYRYSIDGVEFTSSENFTNLSAGNYVVHVNDFKGCVDTFPEVFVFEPDKLIVDLGPDQVIPFGTNTTLTPKIFNNSGPISYDWVSANLELLSCTTCANPVFEGQREASYELVITDERGCFGSDFVTIRLENYSPLFVPTAFTPNGDGENEVLRVYGARIKKVENFSIYDRWGELVFSISDLEIGDEGLHWNGTFKGDEAASGLYQWFGEVIFENGFKESFKGSTTLLR